MRNVIVAFDLEEAERLLGELVYLRDTGNVTQSVHTTIRRLRNAISDARHAAAPPSTTVDLVGIEVPGER